MMKFLLPILLCCLCLQSLANEVQAAVENNFAVSVAFDREGVLWRASVADGFVFIDHSIDKGKTFVKKIKVDTKSQEVVERRAVRPKIAIGPQGNIYLAWTQGLKNRFTGGVWFSRSMDGGESFEQAKLVHQSQAEMTYRFDAISVTPNGKITVTWVDESGLTAEKKENTPGTGAAVYYAVSTDKGATFQQKQKLTDGNCQCCRISTTTKPDGTVVAFWGHIFEGNQRDYMIAELPKAGNIPKLIRVTFGGWKIEGCSHHGVALARGGEGANWWGYHMAYFDGKEKKPGLYYSRMDGEAWVSFPAKKFGDNAKQARQPTLLSVGDYVWLTWLETDIDNTKQVMAMASSDGGRTWSDSKTLLSVKGKANNTQLLLYKDSAYLAVNTVNGLMVTPIRP